MLFHTIDTGFASQRGQSSHTAGGASGAHPSAAPTIGQGKGFVEVGALRRKNEVWRV